MRAYHADILETADRAGTFTATLRGTPITATGTDPEHDLCFAMVAAGLPDGSIQFWRGPTPSLRFGSILRAAKGRIAFEEDGYRLRKRREGPAVFAKDRTTEVAQNRETPLGGIWGGHRTTKGLPEATRATVIAMVEAR